MKKEPTRKRNEKDARNGKCRTRRPPSAMTVSGAFAAEKSESEGEITFRYDDSPRTGFVSFPKERAQR